VGFFISNSEESGWMDGSNLLSTHIVNICLLWFHFLLRGEPSSCMARIKVEDYIRAGGVQSISYINFPTFPLFSFFLFSFLGVSPNQLMRNE